MSTDICEVIITAPDVDWLADFTRQLVEQRLVASGHITSSIRSIYRWTGRVYDDTEARVALHTRPELFDAITAATNEQHPYEVPCIIAIPIVNANPVYQAWVLEMTSDASPSLTRDSSLLN